jgi:hypothetical protein
MYFFPQRYFGKFDVAPIQVDFGKVAPHPKQTKNEKNKMKQTDKPRDSQRLPKKMSLAYVTLEGYNNILNAKDPNMKLFSIPIVLACKMLRRLQTIITTIGTILH